MARVRTVLLILPVFCLAVASPALAAAKRFDFRDPKGVNAVAVTLDSLLEPVTGIATGVSGTVEFDPADPRRTTGKIVVDVTSLDFGNERYTQTAHSARGLDAASHPTIEFVLKQVKSVRRSGEYGYVGQVEGEFTCHGVTRPVTIPLRATYLEGKARDRNRRQGGDLLVLRTLFTIKRSDYKIAEGLASELLAEEVEIRASIVGVAPEGAAPAPAAAPATAPAARPDTARVALGQPVANFTLPSATDGRPVLLFDGGNRQATVVIFLSAFCPVSGAYDERLRAMAERYAARGVRFLAVNADASETAAEAAEHAARGRFPFSMLKDSDALVADRFQAMVTPEAYVIDAGGVLRYRGRIDDNQDPARVRQHDLQAALDAVLAGRTPARAETKAFGCLIQRAPRSQR